MAITSEALLYSEIALNDIYQNSMHFMNIKSSLTLSENMEMYVNASGPFLSK